DWALRDMLVEHDGKAAFAATLDADSEGEEGKFYVWSEDEIDALLQDKAPGFKAAYDVTGLGNWEGSNILNRRGGIPPADEVAEKKLLEARDILFRARAERVPPGRDDKVLADWNGMMIAAIARAAFVCEQDEWMAAARSAYDFVTANLGADTALAHSWHAGVNAGDKGGEPQLRGLGTLDDYAQMARAAIALYQYQGDAELLQQAQRWVDHLNNHFWNNDHGGYYMASDQATDLIVRPRHAVDQATPSGNGIMVEVLASLFFLTGDQGYMERMEALVRSFSGEIERNFFPLGTLINSVDYIQRCRQIVVVGRDDELMTEGLIDAVRRRSRYDLLLSVIDDAANLPGGHPAKGKSRVEDKPTAYLCAGMACQPPVTEPTDLSALLDHPAGHSGANDNQVDDG
ncbi:MAG: thioredoxin domain-containing protein, partial [Pseudomonadota bacterium]